MRDKSTEEVKKDPGIRAGSGNSKAVKFCFVAERYGPAPGSSMAPGPQTLREMFGMFRRGIRFPETRPGSG